MGPRPAALFYFASIVATALATGMVMALTLLEFLTGAVLTQMGDACLGIFAAGHGFLTASRLNYLLAAAALTVVFLQLAFLIGGGQKLIRLSRGSSISRQQRSFSCPALDVANGSKAIKKLHLLECSDAEVTARTVGLLRPGIYLSAGLMRHLSPEQLWAVVAHEEAHRRWRDNLVIAVAKILSLSLFYLPGPRLALSQMRKFMERAADQRAAGTAGGSFTVAGALMSILTVATGERETQLASSATGGDLSDRIEYLLKDKNTARNRSRRLLVATAVAAALAGSLFTFASSAFAATSIEDGDALVCFTRHHVPDDDGTCELEHGAGPVSETSLP